MSLKYFIIGYLTNIFSAIGLIYSFSKLSNKSIKISFNNFIAISILIILICINNYYNLATFKIFTALILTTILEKIIFKESIKDTFINVIIITLLSIVLEFISSPIVSIFITDVNNLNANGIIKMIYSILHSILLMIVIKKPVIIKYAGKLRKIIKEFTNFYNLSLFFVCGLNIIMYIFGDNLRNIRFLIIIVICTTLVSLCLKTIINDKYNNKLLKEKNQNLKDEHKAYSKTIDDCRELRHNLKNELYSLKTILPKEQQMQINNIITKYNNNYEWINTLNDIPEGLQGLLYLKINESKNKKIKIYLNIKSSLKTAENDYIDLSTILGILIDNAIEASEFAKSKTILINITEDRSIITIEIINKFKNSIDTCEIGNKNYSTKEYKSGLGLDFINKMNKSNIKVTFKIINNLFTTTLIYKNKKN